MRLFDLIKISLIVTIVRYSHLNAMHMITAQDVRNRIAKYQEANSAQFRGIVCKNIFDCEDDPLFLHMAIGALDRLIINARATGKIEDVPLLSAWFRIYTIKYRERLKHIQSQKHDEK